MFSDKFFRRPLNIAVAGILAVLCTGPGHAVTQTITLPIVHSVGSFGDPENTVLHFNIGAGSRVISVAYDLSIESYAPSWLSELNLNVAATDGSGGLSFAPGMAYSHAGVVDVSGAADLVAAGLDFAPAADGVLRLQFSDAFDDSDLKPEGLWRSGTIEFNYLAAGASAPDTLLLQISAVPELPSAALMALGLAAVGFGRRTRH